MSRIVALFVGVMLSLVLGIASRPSEVAAAVVNPAACPKYQCKTIHAVWLPTEKFVRAYFVPGGMPGAAVGDAGPFAVLPGIYTPLSAEQLPRVADVRVDELQFPACVPKCGIDGGNGLWQSPQEVTEKGVFNPLPAARTNAARKVCTPTEEGAEGPKQPNPTNDANPGTPPGYLDAEPPPIGGP